jgi:hypothetical protein
MLAASAAGVDGRWNGEMVSRGNKAPPPQPFTLTLSTQNGQVTGSMAMAGRKKARPLNIQNARIDGNRLTFTTVQMTKKAETKFDWNITVDGDQLSGTRTREGAKRGATFKARRAG